MLTLDPNIIYCPQYAFSLSRKANLKQQSSVPVVKQLALKQI